MMNSLPSPAEIREFQRLPLPELMAQALAVKLQHRGAELSLCSIMNAKSGNCGEDCRFCVQSAHYHTSAPEYPLVGMDAVLDAAREAKRNNATHFSLVTSGRGLPGREVERVAVMVAEIRKIVGIAVCASLGILSREALRELKSAGLSRYHHNIETSEAFFPQVVSTHTYAERIATMEAARDAGLEVCAGGIIGLGESEEDRIAMARDLAVFGVDSIPLNILIPLPGTPMADFAPLTTREILRAIALFRLIKQQGAIRLCAGRESVLKDFLAMAFMAGADGMMIGGYLTQRGRLPEEDKRLVNEIKAIWNELLAG